MSACRWCSVCPFVRPSVCLSRSWIMSKRINISSNFFHRRVATSHAILVFPYQTGWRYSDGNLPNGGVECRWGIGRNRDFGLIAGYRWLLDVRSAKNIYRRRSWVYDTVGHAPLAIDRLLDLRTTKWQKQLTTTLQCRSHSRRRTIECLFVTACSMDEYAEEKRTEKNLIVGLRSGRGGLYLKPKQLIIKDCARRFILKLYTDEASRGLCDSTACCYEYF